MRLDRMRKRKGHGACSSARHYGSPPGAFGATLPVSGEGFALTLASHMRLRLEPRLRPAGARLFTIPVKLAY